MALINWPGRHALAAAGLLLTWACEQPPEIQTEVGSNSAASAGTSSAPVVVAVDPPNGASNVDPSRTTLSVTFDREMNREGWSWVIEGPATAPELGDASFDATGRTNTVNAQLKPGRTYVLWINSDKFNYFKDVFGTTATPYRWTFQTTGERQAHLAELGVDGPRVVALDPPDGATDVDPDTQFLRVTFDRPMREGWSWVIEPGQTFPELVGDPSFDAEHRTNTVAVHLQPATTYVIWLNSSEFNMFQGEDGLPAEPVRWVFSTSPSAH